MSIVINTNNGGGGTQNWDNVLSQPGGFTVGHSFNFNSYNLIWFDIGFFDMEFRSADSGFTIRYDGDNFFTFSKQGTEQSFYFYHGTEGAPNFFQFYLDAASNLFTMQLGDYQGTYNNTYISINDDSAAILIKANNSLILNTSSFTINTPTATGVHTPTAQHLPVIVNGTQYYLQLLN
jgi:hypothetical protein